MHAVTSIRSSIALECTETLIEGTGATACAATAFITEDIGECNFDQLTAPDIYNESELHRRAFGGAEREDEIAFIPFCKRWAMKSEFSVSKE